MRTTTRTTCLCTFIFLIIISAQSQEQRAFNQNASSSNHTKITNTIKRSGFTFSLTGDYHKANTDSIAAKAVFLPGVSVHYYNGNWGAGAEFGTFTSSPHFNIADYTEGIRSFITTDIISTEWKSWFLLAGPSYRKSFGGKHGGNDPFVVSADLHGGLMKMKPAAFSIYDTKDGTLIADYYNRRKVSTEIEDPIFTIKPNLKLEWFPGGGGIGLNIHANYLQAIGAKEMSTYYRDFSKVNYNNGATPDEVRLQVLNSPVIESKTKGPVSGYSFGGGISIRFGSSDKNTRHNAVNTSRDAQSGMATGKRLLPTVNKREIAIDEPGVQHTITETYSVNTARDAQSGMATGRRLLPTVNKREIAIDEPGVQRTITETYAVNTARDAQSGMATGRRYRPGRPVYGNITMQPNESCGPVTLTTTNPDGTTEQRTFACPDDAAQYGERMNTNDPTSGEMATNQLHREGIIHRDLAARNIISGTVMLTSSAGNPSYGIVTNNSIINNNSQDIGGTKGNEFVASTIYAREASSGMATGRRTKDAASGQATGRRQYEPVFNEETNNACSTCAVTAHLVAHELTHVVQQSQGSAKENPLYNGNAQQGINPMHESNRAINNDDENCDGIAGLDIYLIDISSGAIIASTKTEHCGHFFFANVPSAFYIVKVAGSISRTKAYDVNINQDGKYDVAGEMLAGNDQWIVQINSNSDNSGNQKVSINTTRSNIKRVTLISADTDGDGQPESFRAIGTFSDGSSKDITAKTGNNTHTVSLPADANARTGKQGANLVGLNLSDRYTVTATFSDGSSRDITNDAKLSHHPNVVQATIDVEDTDGDGFADAIIKTKTKSNQSNDRTTSANDENEIWSPRSNIKVLPVATGDLDGDNVPEFLVGGMMPGGSVISSAMRPGSPIKGVIVKGGRNPGGDLRTTQTNEYGEFEFIDLEKGTYTISADLKFYIDDETVVTAGDDDNDELNERKGWDGTVKGNSQSKDQNDNARKGWDGSVKGKIINSGDMGKIAMDAKEPVTFRWTTLVPKPKEPVTYRLRVWQLMQGQNGTQAKQANQPIFEKIITGATEMTTDGVLTGPCKPPYLCDFIWSVQAINKEGNPQGNATGGSFSADQSAANK